MVPNRDPEVPRDPDWGQIGVYRGLSKWEAKKGSKTVIGRVLQMTPNEGPYFNRFLGPLLGLNVPYSG